MDNKKFTPHELSMLRAWHTGIQRAKVLEEEALTLFKARIMESQQATTVFDSTLSEILISKGMDPKKLTYINLELGEFATNENDNKAP